MAEVVVVLNGRSYRLACREGEETRLQSLAAVVASKVDSLVREFGQAGDDRLLLMAALLVADELLDTRERLAAVEAGGQDVPSDSRA